MTALREHLGPDLWEMHGRAITGLSRTRHEPLLRSFKKGLQISYNPYTRHSRKLIDPVKMALKRYGEHGLKAVVNGGFRGAMAVNEAGRQHPRMAQFAADAIEEAAKRPSRGKPKALHWRGGDYADRLHNAAQHGFVPLANFIVSSNVPKTAEALTKVLEGAFRPLPPHTSRYFKEDEMR